MSSLIQDLKLAFRMLWKRPTFTVITVVALALGIGANTAVFSLVNGVLLQPLRFENPEQLYMVWQTFPAEGVRAESGSPGNFLDWRRRTETFEDMFAFASRGTRLRREGGEPEVVRAGMATPSFFSMLGVPPLQGRAFSDVDPVGGPLPEVVLSHRLWTRAFGAEEGLVGDDIFLDGESYTVVGVMPPEFKFLADADLWLPLRFTSQQAQERANVFLWVVGRVKASVTQEQAEADLESVTKVLEEEFPMTNLGWGATLMPLHQYWVGDVSRTLPLLLGAVAFVLLVACANIATLLLSRATDRRREMALRQTLGAGRGQLIRQTLVESLVLAVLGGIAGVLMGSFGVSLLTKFQPGNIPRIDEVTVDLPVLLFTFGIALLAGIIFGVIPAFQGSKVDLTDSLKEGSSSSSSSGGASLLRNFFVVSEVSLAMVLLIGAGLTVRTFQQLQSVDLGFDPEGAVAAEIILAPDRYQNSNQRMRFIETLLERLEQVPGVQSAGIVSTLPLENTQIDVDIYVEGRSDGQLPSVVGIDAASGEYFRALGTRIVDGRTFNAQDREGSLPVVIINETLAKLYWPGERVLGKRLKLAGFGDDDWQVVGVVEDIRRFGLDAESRREVYIPFRQWAEEPGFFVVLRSTGDNPSPLAGTLRALVDEIDPEQPVASTSVMSDLLTDSLSQRRFNTWLIGISAFVALLLAVLGIYGILAYNVAQRTREIGIRLALGENRGSVLALILRRGLMLAGIGVLIGLGASFLLRQLIASLLHGVEASDPLTLAVVSAIFLGVAALASYFPARRATRVDPMVALRYE